MTSATTQVHAPGAKPAAQVTAGTWPAGGSGQGAWAACQDLLLARLPCNSPGVRSGPSASGPSPLPVRSALSRLRALGTRATAGAAVSPTSGPGPTWGPGARGTSLLSCSTEAVALSRERAWGCIGGCGCGPEGLAGGAPESILPARKTEGQTQGRPGPAYSGLECWAERGHKREMGWGPPHVLSGISFNFIVAP